MSTQTDLTGVAGWAVDLMERLGGPGAGLAIAVENLFPPIPSEVILPFAGYLSHTGAMSLPALILWSTVGAWVGALVLYVLGRCVGLDRTVDAAVWTRIVSRRDAERGAPDMVLMDLGLPGMSGLECIAALRQGLPGLPVVALSSSDDRDTVLAALEVPHEEGDEERRDAGADHGPHALAEARRVRRGVEHELPPRVHDVVPHAVGAGGRASA